MSEDLNSGPRGSNSAVDETLDAPQASLAPVVHISQRMSMKAEAAIRKIWGDYIGDRTTLSGKTTVTHSTLNESGARPATLIESLRMTLPARLFKDPQQDDNSPGGKSNGNGSEFSTLEERFREAKRRDAS